MQIIEEIDIDLLQIEHFENFFVHPEAFPALLCIFLRLPVCYPDLFTIVVCNIDVAYGYIITVRISTGNLPILDKNHSEQAGIILDDKITTIFRAQNFAAPALIFLSDIQLAILCLRTVHMMDDTPVIFRIDIVLKPAFGILDTHPLLEIVRLDHRSQQDSNEV